MRSRPWENSASARVKRLPVQSNPVLTDVSQGGGGDVTVVVGVSQEVKDDKAS